MSGGITITGLQETMELLREAPRTLVARGYTKALSAAGNVIADRLEVNTPIKAQDTGGILDRGELREAITVAVELDSQFRGGSVDVGFDPRKGADHVALWLDSGHRLVGHKPGKKQLGTFAGTGFMRRTADETAEAAIDKFAESLKETASEVFPQGQVA
jgi:hypothetical protein